MLQSVIDEIGRLAFAPMIRAVRMKRRQERSALLGFDTEYTSKGHALLSFQLAGDLGERFVPASKLDPDTLARACREIVHGETRSVVLLAYFSIAELQHIDVFKYAVDVYSYGQSVDFVFYSRRFDLVMRVFDLARFFDRSPLSRVAEIYGFRKLEWARANVTRKDLTKRRFREYAVHDARLCLDIAKKLQEGFASSGVDPLFEATPAGCAATAYRLTLSGDIRPPNSRVRLTAMRACWGGRAEAFRRGKVGQVREYDITSAYPRAASSFECLPVRGSWRPFDRLSQTKRMLGGVALARFSFPKGTAYPSLPVSTKHALIYPLAGATSCTLDELRVAQEMGASISIVEGYGFSSGDSSFPEYMAALQEKRAACKDPTERVALKLLANSCIGKLAQRVNDADALDLIKLARSLDIQLGGRMTRAEYEALGVRVTVRTGSLWFPEWNGLITGRVRAILSRAIAETEAVYSATDAVWSKRAPAPYLGASWELKRKGYAVVARTRLAMMGDHIPHHGIWRRDVARELLSGDIDGTIQYETEKPRKLKEAIRDRERFGEWRTLTRTADASWDGKRRLFPDGSTEPWPTEEAYAEARRRDQSAKRSRRRPRDNRKRARG